MYLTLFNPFMQQLTKDQFTETIIPPMREFMIKEQEHLDYLGSMAKEILQSMAILPKGLNLEKCVENGDGSYAHFVMNWEQEGKLLVLVSDEINQKWEGFYLIGQ